MEEVFGDNRLGELEEKIDYLLKIYRDVKGEKEGLTGKIASLEAENRELKALDGTRARARRARSWTK